MNPKTCKKTHLHCSAWCMHSFMQATESCQHKIWNCYSYQLLSSLLKIRQSFQEKKQNQEYWLTGPSNQQQHSLWYEQHEKSHSTTKNRTQILKNSEITKEQSEYQIKSKKDGRKRKHYLLFYFVDKFPNAFFFLLLSSAAYSKVKEKRRELFSKIFSTQTTRPRS